MWPKKDQGRLQGLARQCQLFFFFAFLAPALHAHNIVSSSIVHLWTCVEHLLYSFASARHIACYSFE